MAGIEAFCFNNPSTSPVNPGHFHGKGSTGFFPTLNAGKNLSLMMDTDRVFSEKKFVTSAFKRAPKIKFLLFACFVGLRCPDIGGFLPLAKRTSNRWIRREGKDKDPLGWHTAGGNGAFDLSLSNPHDHAPGHRVEIKYFMMTDEAFQWIGASVGWTVLHRLRAIGPASRLMF